MELSLRKENGGCGHEGNFRRTQSQKFLFDDLSKKNAAEDYSPLIFQTCFTNAYRRTNNDIKHQTFNSLLSGSTLTTILITKDYIFSANVGDSKAVLFTLQKLEIGSGSSTKAPSKISTPNNNESSSLKVKYLTAQSKITWEETS